MNNELKRIFNNNEMNINGDYNIKIIDKSNKNFMNMAIFAIQKII